MNTAVTSLPLTSVGDASDSFVGGLRHWLNRTGKSLWTALEANGRARAHRHLLDFADRCEALQPELAKELRAASRQAG